jgi:hypothetical protein
MLRAKSGLLKGLRRREITAVTGAHGKTLSPERMHFPSTGSRQKRVAELKSPELVTIYNCYPEKAGAQSAYGARQDPSPGQRSGRNLESNGGEAGQGAAGSQQGSPCTDI